jgi:hypothetical protein
MKEIGKNKKEGRIFEKFIVQRIIFRKMFQIEREKE